MADQQNPPAEANDKPVLPMSTPIAPPAGDKTSDKTPIAASSQPPPTPAAPPPADKGQTSKKEADSEAGSGDGEDIRDPVAWATSQKEKFDRLAVKYEDRIQKLEGQIKTLEADKESAIRQEVKTMQDELVEATKAANKTLLDAVRLKALINAGFGEAHLRYVTATDPDGIQKDVEGLIALRSSEGQQQGGVQGRQRRGNAPGQQTGKNLASWFTYHTEHQQDSPFGRMPTDTED